MDIIVGCTAIDAGERSSLRGQGHRAFTPPAAGRIYQSTTNAHINTGDGVGVKRAGGRRAGHGVLAVPPHRHRRGRALVTEGCRGEGGYLLNKDGERFMERYAPNARTTNRSRRGGPFHRQSRSAKAVAATVPGARAIKLKLDHLGKEVLESRLPASRAVAPFAHVDPVKEPIPIIPTCHYAVGGVPTSVNGQCLTQDKDGNDVPVGRSVRGGRDRLRLRARANRLGGNSLLIWLCSVVLPACNLVETLGSMGARRGAPRRRHRQGAGAFQTAGENNRDGRTRPDPQGPGSAACRTTSPCSGRGYMAEGAGQLKLIREASQERPSGRHLQGVQYPAHRGA